MTSSYPGFSPSQNRSDFGNRQRIIELYELLRPSLRAYLCARQLSQEHAEDVIQETFLRLVRHSERHGTHENLRAWAFRVAHNISVDLYRSEKRWFSSSEPQPILRGRVDPSPNPEQKVILREQVRQFQNAYARLTPKQQHCVLLRAEGFRYREIARILAVSVQRVGEMMQRAITLLAVREHVRGAKGDCRGRGSSPV